MEFRQLIAERRSVRSYDSPVDHGDLAAILREAQQAPSWGNQQTARCYAVEDPQLLEELRAEALPASNQKNSANAVLLVTTFVKDGAGFRAGEPANEVGNGWGAYDLGLRDAYLILAARDRGYDTLIMGMRDSGVIRTKLGIPEDETVMSVIAIGKRAAEPTTRARKELEEVVKFF